MDKIHIKDPVAKCRKCGKTSRNPNAENWKLWQLCYPCGRELHPDHYKDKPNHGTGGSWMSNRGLQPFSVYGMEILLRKHGLEFKNP